MKIPFTKMSGSGNDFIFIDHRKPILSEDEMKEFARKVCRRRVSVGADGLVLVERAEKADIGVFRVDSLDPLQFYKGLAEPGEVCDVVGTAEPVCAASSEPREDPTMLVFPRRRKGTIGSASRSSASRTWARAACSTACWERSG